MTTDSTVPKKSRPQPPGGSRKGIPNKVTSDLKKMIMTALDGAGGVEYLIRQADEKPAAFLALVGKVLPLQVANAEGEAFVVATITRRVIDTK